MFPQISSFGVPRNRHSRGSTRALSGVMDQLDGVVWPARADVPLCGTFCRRTPNGGVQHPQRGAAQSGTGLVRRCRHDPPCGRRDPGGGHLLGGCDRLAGTHGHAHQRVVLGDHRPGCRAQPGRHDPSRPRDSGYARQEGLARLHVACGLLTALPPPCTAPRTPSPRRSDPAPTGPAPRAAFAPRPAPAENP